MFLNDKSSMLGAAHVSVASLVAALAHKQLDPFPDFLSMKSIVSVTVDIIQSRPQTEGWALAAAMLTFLSGTDDGITVASLISSIGSAKPSSKLAEIYSLGRLEFGDHKSGYFQRGFGKDGGRRTRPTGGGTTNRS